VLFEQPFYQGVCDTGSVWISLYVEGDTRLRVGAGLAVRW